MKMPPPAEKTSSPSTPMARKFFKRIVDADLVVPDLITANPTLDFRSTKEQTNVRLGTQPLKEGRQTLPLIVFRPDRVNVNRRESDPPTRVKWNRDDVSAETVGEHCRFLDRSPCHPPLPPFTGIRRDHVVTAVPRKSHKASIVQSARHEPSVTGCHG
jgi:hypothetical protein